MLDEKDILAQKLKDYRKENNINQFEFAEDCGISRDTLSLIECSKENVTIDTLQLLSARMGKSVADLFSLYETKYFMVPTTITTNNITETTYGIGVLKGDIMINCIPNISKNYNKVLSMVQICNEQLLDPCHLEDVIEDEFN